MTIENAEKLTYSRYNDKGELETVDTFSGEVIHVKSDMELTTSEIKRYIYSETVAMIITDQMRKDGLTLMAVSKLPGFPSYAVLCRWRNENEKFASMIREARRDRAESHIEKISDILKLEMSKDEIPEAKLKIETYKWLAEKDDPENYGTKTKILGDASAPILIRVSTGIDREGSSGMMEEMPIIETTAQEIIDGEVKKDTDERREGSGEISGSEQAGERVPE